MSVTLPKVIINGRFLQRPVTGVERFALQTLRALNTLIEEGCSPFATFEIALPPGTNPTVAFSRIPFKTVGRLTGHLWEQVDLPLYCGRARLLNLCNTAPAFKQNQAVVIHDAAVFSAPQAFSRPFRLAYKAIHRCLAMGRAQLMTVSEFSRQDLAAHLGLNPQRIQVLPESAEHVLEHAPDVAILTRNNLGSLRPYVLAVSSMAPHKNFRLVLEAVSRLGDIDIDIAIAGGANSRVFGAMGLPAVDRVKWLGYVSDGELRALYENAMCFVFPSYYEGFGIPPLEAMQCGCAVLASSAASIPEVCGDAALYFEPDDAETLSQLIMRLHGSTQERERLADAGKARAATFTWRKVAQALVAQALAEDKDRS